MKPTQYLEGEGTSPSGTQRASQYKSSLMTTTDFPLWLDRVMGFLAEVETRYDLNQGEMLNTTNTSTSDLVELHGYGWSAQETSACILEQAGLR